MHVAYPDARRDWTVRAVARGINEEL